MKRGVLVLCFAMMTMSLISCQSKSLGPDDLVKIGKQSISIEDVKNRISQLPREAQSQFSSKETQTLLLEQMVREELMYQEALHRKVHRSESYRVSLKALKKQLLIDSLIAQEVNSKLSKFGLEDAKKYFDENNTQFKAQVRRLASHILVKDKKTADQVLKKLNKGESFDTLAKTYSIDVANKSKGGQLGWVSQDQLVPEFANALFDIRRKGDLSPVIQTKFGFHIIQYLDEKQQEKLEFDQVKDQIIQLLSSQEQQQYFNELISAAQENFEITHRESKQEKADQ